MQTVSSCVSLFARLHIVARALLSAGITVCVLAVAAPVQAQHPDCVSASSDSDGDGWGWENNRSCVVVEDTSSSSDPDGDGFGYEDGESCLVESVEVTSHPICVGGSSSDSDGDGWGWENNATCIVSTDAPADNTGDTNDSTAAPEISAKKAPAFTIDNVTDVVLVTGQSNVLGANTSFDSDLDQPDEQVFAYTDNGEPANSFAFHFGKTLVGRDTNRVVAFIVVPAPGEGISHWDIDGALYSRIQGKVSQALSEIPHKDSIDGILWHQGENDFLYEGTSDANPTGFTSKDSLEYINYYQIKLDALISNFRSEPWASLQTAFICGETRRGEGVNRRLNALNHDNDALTACVPATDLPKRDNDVAGSHFSAQGLRVLGQRYADKYIEIK